MNEIREKIAEIVRRYDPEAEDGLDDPFDLADAILAIPEIADALKARERMIGKPTVQSL